MTLDYHFKALRNDLAQLHAYQIPQLPANCIKLDAMENPFTLPQDVKYALMQHLIGLDELNQFNRYPGAHHRLQQAIKKYANIDEQLAIVCGNGSDEIITLLTQLIPLHAKVMAPVPCFVMYQLNTVYLHRQFIGVDLNEDFTLNVEKFIEAMQQHLPSLIYLAYPNNPTGNCFTEDAILSILKVAKQIQALVVIDEAYYAFTQGKSFMQQLPELLKTYPNVLVLRTVSKIGLAGLRLGYIAGHQFVIEQLNKLRPPYNINTLTYETACFLLNNYAHVFEQQASIILQQRQFLQNELQKLGGQTYISDANFIVWRHPQAQSVYLALQGIDIFIKNIGSMHAHLSNCLRISVGSSEQNAALITALHYLLK